MQLNNAVRRALFATAAAVSIVGLSSGAAFAAAPTTSHAAFARAVRPTNCQNAVNPDGNGREVYTYTGRLVTSSGSFFDHLGDAGDYFYSETFLGDTFVRFCI